MKAAVYENYGPPSVVKIKEVSLPTIKENEVLIKVHASTVNRTDCGFRSAEYFIVRFFAGLFKPKKQVLGNEFSGVVETIGKSVNNFKVGDKVWFCHGGLGREQGNYAEYTVIDERWVSFSPKSFSFAEAAASPLFNVFLFLFFFLFGSKISTSIFDVCI